MKKFFLIGIFCAVLIACKNKPADQKPKPSTPEAFVNCTGIGNYYIDKAPAEDLITHFSQIFRKDQLPAEKNDSLSSSVWVDKCVIQALNNYLQDGTLGLDGIRVYMAAYKDRTTYNAPGQAYDNQSTIIFVPTNPNAGNARAPHLDNWDVITPSQALPGAYNHGELCPNNCN